MKSNNFLQKLVVKQLSSSIINLEVLYGKQSWSMLVWLLWWSNSRRFFKEPFIFVNCDGVFGWPFFFPRKEEIVDWLSHISRVKNLLKSNPTWPVISDIISIVPSWFSVMRTCIWLSSLKSLLMISIKCHTWIGISNRAETKPRHCFSHLDSN